MSVSDVCSVTVVIPVYNSGGTLHRAIQSVLEQTLTDFELLIVDDGSSDDSLAVAERAAALDARVKVVALNCNVGKARAVNQAMDMAVGTWIAILDADDRYMPRRLATLVEAGSLHDVQLVADNQLHTDDATGLVNREAFDAAGPGRPIGLTDFIAHSNPAATFDFGILKPMVQTDFLRRNRLAYVPEARLAEDFYFMMEFFAAGGRGWLVHEPLYEWTLPFSPTRRRWTTTGSGAWRYDYRNALQINQAMLAKSTVASRPELIKLLKRRAREYGVMIPYLDAQRILAVDGDRVRALRVIAAHPGTWPLLARRVYGRLLRVATSKVRAAKQR